MRPAPLFIFLCACSQAPRGTGTPGAFDRNAFLTQLSHSVIEPCFVAFSAKAQALASAPTRSTWGDAMDAWQECELLQLGPAGMIGQVTGGADFRDTIYAWPSRNTCSIDQATAAQSFNADDFFTTSTVNTYGLFALEYLLFHDGPSHTCTTSFDATWNALGASEVATRRAAHAARLAQHVAARASELVEAWRAWAPTLNNAGQSGSAFTSAQEAVNEVYAALYYLELGTKDKKLALPTGLSPKCLQDTCPEQAELRLAKRSKQAIRANLVAFKRAFDVGFDDMLADAGAGSASVSILADLDAAIALIDAMPGTFEDALATDLPSAEALHTAVKKVTDSLKSQVVTALNLRVPQEGAGDND